MAPERCDVTIVLGTRPEIIKFSPIIRLLEERNQPHTVVHTGQHYSSQLNSVFFTNLGLSSPDYNLGVGSGSHGHQTGEMLARIESILQLECPDAVLVQGDTNSALAGGIAGCKLDCKLGHVEAGLRSFNRGMPEELNRIICDHASDHLFAPTAEGERHLKSEGIPDERIHITGNTIVDAVQQNVEIATEVSTVLSDFDLESGEYALLTAHREENVDRPERFADILSGVAAFADEQDIDCVFPIHPRTEQRVQQYDIEIPERIYIVEPLDFLDFLTLENETLVAFTDSGGVQEEACILNTPCVTTREETERPETLSIGANQLAGTNPDTIAEAAKEMVERPTDWDPLFGDGNAAERILDVLKTDDH